MAVRVVWTPQAVADLDAIGSFIARDAMAHAREFAARGMQAVELLEAFPSAGGTVPVFAEDSLRELIHGHDRTLQEVTEEEVQLLTIHHAARLLRERPAP